MIVHTWIDNDCVLNDEAIKLRHTESVCLLKSCVLNFEAFWRCVLDAEVIRGVVSQGSILFDGNLRLASREQE